MLGRQLGTLLRLPPLRNAYLIRGALIWTGIRTGLALFGFLSPGSPVFELVPLAEAWLIGAVAVTVLLDARRRSEDVLLGNLGVPAWAIAVMGCPLAVLLSVLLEAFAP